MNRDNGVIWQTRLMIVKDQCFLGRRRHHSRIKVHAGISVNLAERLGWLSHNAPVPTKVRGAKRLGTEKVALT